MVAFSLWEVIILLICCNVGPCCRVGGYALSYPDWQRTSPMYVCCHNSSDNGKGTFSDSSLLCYEIDSSNTI